jgi:hypothetical protein
MMKKVRILTILWGLGMALVVIGWLLGWAAAGWTLGSFQVSPIYRRLITSGAILASISICLKWLDNKRAKRRGEEFLRDLKVIADDLTLSDEEDRLDDLLFLYDEEERKDILDRLQRLPKGARKLQVVLDQVDQEAV